MDRCPKIFSWPERERERERWTKAEADGHGTKRL